MGKFKILGMQSTLMGKFKILGMRLVLEFIDSTKEIPPRMSITIQLSAVSGQYSSTIPFGGNKPWICNSQPTLNLLQQLCL
jgi:hypothetical protein